MMKTMQTITVNLGDRSYPIHIGNGLIDRIGGLIRDRLGACAAAIVTDDNVAPLYLARVEASLDAAGIRHASAVQTHGEETKCLGRLAELYDFLSESRITRSDVVIALGGGVIGDLAGMAAATWLRGVRFVQLPTTLLAQVDASVGGKVAVDLPQGKNLVGAFWQPSLVAVDPDTLLTLPEQVWRDGLGEVVKYGCIGDEALFTLLEEAAPAGRTGLMAHIGDILTRCIDAKAEIVAQDERDTGLRKTLNFGHTIAHAIEAAQHYGGFRHGEAVAAGMAEITRLSEARGLTEPGTLDRLTALEKALGLPYQTPDLPEDALLSALAGDKKHDGAQLTVVLLASVGHCFLHRTDARFFEDA